MLKTKICKKCGEQLPATTEYFYKVKGNKDGLHGTCKKCRIKQVGIALKKRRKKGRHLIHDLVCDWCNKDFKADKKHQRFCSTDCQYEWQRESEEYHGGITDKQLLRLLNNKTCKSCGRIYSAKRTNQEYCSERCMQRKFNRQRRMIRRVKAKSNGEVDWGITLSGLIKRDKNICHICEDVCNKKDYIINNSGHYVIGSSYPTVDHIIPISKGGTHTWNNVKLAHHYCNSIRGNEEIKKQY